MTALAGDPAQVRVAAAVFETSATATSAVASNVSGAQIASWTGDAGDAFRGDWSALRTDVKDHSEDLQRGSEVLMVHATELEAINAQALDALERWRAAADRLLSLPPDLSAFTDLYRAQADLRHAIDLRVRLSQRTADNLYGLISADAAEVEGYTWPPAGWPAGGSWADDPLPSTILDDATFDPEDVSQGGIGDCYVISTVMALMQTPEGDALLRENIRWDSVREGYWVTLYVDGKPTPIFIDHALHEGALEDGGPGIVSLYEAAFSEYESWATLSGGSAHDVFPVIAGTDAERINWDAGDGDTWDPGPAREALDDGGYVVASSHPTDDPAPTIQVTKQNADGSTYTTDVRIVGPHAYTVAGVEADGSVWVMNPWGQGNSYDDGGPFLVSAEDFEELFRAVSISEGLS